jgi:hypothetical protein
MPGSLFPRSTTIEPESPPQSTADHDEDRDRRVRFAPGILSPPRPRVSFDEEIEAGSSQDRLDLNSCSITSSMTSTALGAQKYLLHPRSIPSVKAAVQRFRVGDDDANPFILLPGPNTSPGKVNGKGKAREDVSLTGKHINMRENALTEEGDIPCIPSSGKGKEPQRARDPLLECLDVDTSGENRVRGKERELVAAREEQRRNERRWEKDKDERDDEADKERLEERIRMLEGEVLRLKEEVHNFTYYFLLLL